MYTSFYTAARGASTQQTRMDITANNLANVNNMGYKPKNAVFSDLVYYNMMDDEQAVTKMEAGAGVKVEVTNTNFNNSGYQQTEEPYDYAIEGKGFFRLQDPTTGDITYTRSGRFSLSLRGTQFYLVSDGGKLVTDATGAPITVTDGEVSGEPGVYAFLIENGIQSVGDNEFAPLEKNGAPYINGEAKLMNGVLEMSGVDVALEMTKVIETQTAYSYALKMVQTSDEVTETINNLKQ